MQIAEMTVEQLAQHRAMGRINSARWRDANPERARAMVRVASARWRIANPEKALAQGARTRAEHPDRVRVYNDRWRAANPERARELGRAKSARWLASLTPEKRATMYRARALMRYKVTPTEYDALLASQGGVCAICGVPPTKLLEVDHDHTSGRVRGLLCGRCNTGLGVFCDSPALMTTAIAYLGNK